MLHWGAEETRKSRSLRGNKSLNTGVRFLRKYVPNEAQLTTIAPDVLLPQKLESSVIKDITINVKV